ncbi:MAG: methionine--tRNA ligase [Gammaproteobacteria bacterium]|nr:methionine--tRNA ligase [Gammaproteobacteria bacterium]MCP4091066.1 methionine--tRNA ligase [Gammaproteobacteria bacterium]MCP4277408.1 methionine--tRNA ligase [Gammaproteobacteria bacterium]MCP4831531.1 methionine--tRNA ligase [Gammaproteobacteria bacterium]
MAKKPRKLLVTSALPYANGPIHIGHLVEYLQTDIWVRFQKLKGNNCTYICASDAHGTPIMLRARKEGISPEELVERYRIEHQQDFSGFHIAFDNYHSTHSEENHELVEQIYNNLVKKDLIERRTIQQAYDEEAGMFLPDRFLRGTCPRCNAQDQYGDNCEVCGATYSTSELKDPQSILSDTTPVQRDSEHLFFKLQNFAPMLQEWISGGAVDDGIARKLNEWFEAGLQDWDISRDAPYFGFRIPGTDDKYFYVWLDAPVGYLASFKNLCKKRSDLNFDEYFSVDSSVELYHFIGKDIVYFHALFWPSVLEGAGYRKPTSVFTHGFLTVNGQKMSKSRGTFIAAKTWLEHLDPECLRYYYAVKLGANIEDIDLNLEDFTAKINSDLVGKLVNIASRCAGFITRNFDGQLAEELEQPALYSLFVTTGDTIARHYEQREYSRAMREIMQLADRANQYIDERKPWVLAKDKKTASDVQAVCTQGLNLFRVLMIYLSPVLPAMAYKVAEFLDTGTEQWQSRSEPLLNKRINPFKPLMTRIDSASVEKMIEASKKAGQASTQPVKEKQDDKYISIDDFLKIDLRVATVISAAAVEGADKLLQVILDDGSGQRTVLAGIKSAYSADELTGRQVIVVANLKPRKMRFGTSEGMILAAGDDEIFLISPDNGAEPGMRVR